MNHAGRLAEQREKRTASSALRRSCGVRCCVALGCLIVLVGAVGPALGQVPQRAPEVHYLVFNTGTDPGQTYPAVICTIAPLGEAGLTCWTPNDGYTINLLGLLEVMACAITGPSNQSSWLSQWASRRALSRRRSSSFLVKRRGFRTPSC